jgi:hypothetical protein
VTPNKRRKARLIRDTLRFGCRATLCATGTIDHKSNSLGRSRNEERASRQRNADEFAGRREVQPRIQVLAGLRKGMNAAEVGCLAQVGVQAVVQLMDCTARVAVKLFRAISTELARVPLKN